jgi:hypothetical protein
MPGSAPRRPARPGRVASACSSSLHSPPKPRANTVRPQARNSPPSERTARNAPETRLDERKEGPGIRESESVPLMFARWPNHKTGRGKPWHHEHGGKDHTITVQIEQLRCDICRMPSCGAEAHMCPNHTYRELCCSYTMMDWKKSLGGLARQSPKHAHLRSSYRAMRAYAKLARTLSMRDFRSNTRLPSSACRTVHLRCFPQC